MFSWVRSSKNWTMVSERRTKVERQHGWNVSLVEVICGSELVMEWCCNSFNSWTVKISTVSTQIRCSISVKPDLVLLDYYGDTFFQSAGTQWARNACHLALSLFLIIFLSLRLSPYVIQVILGAVSVAGTIPALVRLIFLSKGLSLLWLLVSHRILGAQKSKWLIHSCKYDGVSHSDPVSRYSLVQFLKQLVPLLWVLNLDEPSGNNLLPYQAGLVGHFTLAPQGTPQELLTSRNKQGGELHAFFQLSWSSCDIVNVTRWHSHCIRCITRLLLCNLLGSNAVCHGIPSPSFSLLNVIFPFFRWVYLGESFPLRVRPKSIALGSATNWLVFIHSFSWLLIRKSCSGSGTSSWASLLRGLLKSAFHLLLFRVSRILGYDVTKSLSCTMS